MSERYLAAVAKRLLILPSRNLGVETGQVIFVVCVSLLLAGIRRLHIQTAEVLLRTAPYPMDVGLS